MENKYKRVLDEVNKRLSQDLFHENVPYWNKEIISEFLLTDSRSNREQIVFCAHMNRSDETREFFEEYKEYLENKLRGKINYIHVLSV